MAKNKFLSRFLIYQRERFPLLVLSFTTLAVVLSSYAIASTLTTISNVQLKIFFAIVAAIAYLFHIRAIDEYRDLNHDTQYHQSRPIQRGIISTKEIRYIDYFGLLIFIGIAILYRPQALILGAIALIFSFIASKDFFLGERIRKRFFIYNTVNLTQTILLQIFTYSFFSEIWYAFPTLWLHLLFVLSNSILIEFVRKIKIKEEESTGRDTYSWHFGFKKSLWVYGLLITISYFLFLGLTTSLYILDVSTFVISAIFVTLLVGAIFRHLKQEDKSSEKLLLLNTLVLYIGLHLVIYFSIKF